MSLDYPEYKRLKKAHPVLGMLWRLGDCLYYQTLMGSVVLPLLFIHQKAIGQWPLSWGKTLGMAIAAFFGGLLLTLLCGHLKNLALMLGGGFHEYQKQVRQHQENRHR